MSLLLSANHQACLIIANGIGMPASTIGWRGSALHAEVEFFIEGGGATQWKKSKPLFTLKEPIDREQLDQAITTYRVVGRLTS